MVFCREHGYNVRVLLSSSASPCSGDGGGREASSEDEKRLCKWRSDSPPAPVSLFCDRKDGGLFSLLLIINELSFYPRVSDLSLLLLASAFLLLYCFCYRHRMTGLIVELLQHRRIQPDHRIRRCLCLAPSTSLLLHLLAFALESKGGSELTSANTLSPPS